MADLKELLQARLQALDDEHQRHMDVYGRRRAALLTTMEWVDGTVEKASIMEALKTGAAQTAQLIADNARSPSSPIDTELHGVSGAYILNQLDVVMEAIRQLPDKFNKDAVTAKLEGSEWRLRVTDNTLTNIASFLWRLRKDGRINIVTQGQGHRQSVYTVAEKEKEPPVTQAP